MIDDFPDPVLPIIAVTVPGFVLKLMFSIHEDYIQIQYDGGDVLYVPLYQFNLVRKYVGKEGYAPKLNRLYTTRWETTKKKIKERINDLAERLMVLYSDRAKAVGFSFKPEPDFEIPFANDFKYDLTKDQEKSLKEIYGDMFNFY